MRQLRCGHDQRAPQVRPTEAGGPVVAVVTVADRRHVHTWVPTATVPQAAPTELAGVARAVTVDGAIVGWWFDVAAALTAEDTSAAARFTRWSAEFTRRSLLGEVSTVDAVIAQLAPAAGGHLDSYSAGDRFCALGGGDLGAFLGTEYDVEVAAGAATGDVVELCDAGGAPVRGRVWPAKAPLTLTEEGAVSVGVADGEMWCQVGETRHRVTGWRIDGETGDVLIDTGAGQLPIDGAAGTVLTRQAAGHVQVQVRTRRFSHVCSEVAETIYDAADTAARAGRYLLIGVEPQHHTS